MKADKQLLTLEDLKRLQEELRHLMEVERPEIVRQIQAAREQGDLSENADYDSAKNEQGLIERRINEIKTILDNSQIIDSSLNVKGKVSISNTVRFRDLDSNLELEFQIVGSEGSDPEKHKISNESPLARAIMNKKRGDVVEVKGIEKPYKVEILEIK